MNQNTTFYPGTRVLVFDATLFVDDKSTPLSHTVRPATVVCWYGCRASEVLGGYQYPSLIDVQFDHRPQAISRGHFTDAVRRDVPMS